MGHFHDRVKAIGKTKKDAENNAYDAFMYENGQRYDIREIKAIQFIRDVPPKKPKENKQGKYTYISFEEDPTAPRSEWLVEWEFEIHSHA